MLLIGRGLALILHRCECLLQQRSRLHWQVEGNGDRVTSSSSCVADLVESKGERWAIDTTFSIIMTPSVVSTASAEPSSSTLESATSGVSSTISSGPSSPAIVVSMATSSIS
jgi:hypothetical protein